MPRLNSGIVIRSRQGSSISLLYCPLRVVSSMCLCCWTGWPRLRIIAEASVWPTDLRSGPEWAARQAIEVNARCTLRLVSRWGEIYPARRASANQALPTLQEILEQLHFIAIQYPRCGVADWSTIEN
jgi:3-deoxy-D-manno-octulosonic-acid transferase